MRQDDAIRHDASLSQRSTLNKLTVLICESVQSYALSENCVWSDEGSKSHCEAVDTI